MNEEHEPIDHVERHLALCRRIYLRLLSEGKLDEALAAVALKHVEETS